MREGPIYSAEEKTNPCDSSSKEQKDQEGQSEVSPSRNGQMITFSTNTPSYRQQPQPLGMGRDQME